MLQQILSVYLEALLLTSIIVAILAAIWIGWRIVRKKDKTARKRQSHLYDTLLIAIMTTPILTFATVGILMIIRA